MYVDSLVLYRLWLGFSVRFLAAVATREHSYTCCPIAGFGHAAGASLDWQGCLRADLGSRVRPVLSMVAREGRIFLTDLGVVK